MMFPTLCVVAILGILCSLPTAAYNTNDQIGAEIPYGTFQDPSSHVRPRFRYWVPDASVNLSVVAEDFAQAKAVGISGLELLGYYLYGDYPSEAPTAGPVPVDWTKYGWGTEAWKQLLDVALSAAKDNNMLLDFAVGPNQGAGVPATPDNEGLLWDLLPFNASVPIGGTFDGQLPGWGSGAFVSASTALVISSENATFSALPAFNPVIVNGTKQTLASASLADITNEVDASGRVSLRFPSTTNGSHYQVFAYYQVRSSFREQASPLYVESSVMQSPIQSFVQNGSWAVDHFSSKGAQVIIDFWENYLLGGETRTLLQEVGNYGWEDSQEFGAGVLLWWTPRLLQAFETARAYSLNRYLPLLYSYNAEVNSPLASPVHFYTDEADGGQSYVNDYWQTLTELNQLYLQTLSNWTQSSLQSQFSAQVVYNLPMDMLANVPYVNAPECESLGFNHVIDSYRQYSGPANLAGKRVISSEEGAVSGESYSQTLPELMWDVKRSLVGGVNQFVFHGYPFTGNYPNTTWPGFTTFGYLFSGMHGPRQPAWEHYSDYMDWVARMQYVSQCGVPKIDLAFWLKSDQYFDVSSAYLPNDLVEAGFTYEYLSPDNFGLPEAYVQNGILAPARQAFKALVLRGNDTLTVSGVQRLVDFAHDGLPIFISGGVPQNLTGYNHTGTEYVRSALTGILHLPNVHSVPYEGLAASLSELGITPRTSTSAGRVLCTHWREDSNAAVSYIVVYNDASEFGLGQGASEGYITFQTSGVPYTYNAWTGEVSRIEVYQLETSAVRIPISLAGNQSTIIAFHHSEPPYQGPHVVSAPPEAFNISSSNGNLTIKARSTSDQAHMSNGESIALPEPASSVNLTEWKLVVESWTSPTDPTVDQTLAAKANTTHNLTALKPWNQISDSLRYTSGRGFYTTSFMWPPSAAHADGALIDLGYIVHTARVWVNGHQLPPLDPTAPKTDIGQYLVKGNNRIEIVVTTTLSNALQLVFQAVRSSGEPWSGPPPAEQEYGLIAPVMLLPYRTTTVTLQ